MFWAEERAGTKALRQTCRSNSRVATEAGAEGRIQTVCLLVLKLGVLTLESRLGKLPAWPLKHVLYAM